MNLRNSRLTRSWLVGVVAWAIISLAPAKALAGPIVGVGINCHSAKLPINDLRAIGIQWVRLDLAGNQYTSAKLKPLVDYYRDFGQLWIVPQTTPDPAAAARTLVNLGVTDIEVFNEPKLWRISPAAYAANFKRVREAVGSRARLYGPSMGTWSQEKAYLQQCLNSGMRPDVISFHGYWQDNVEQFRDWVNDAKRFGYPIVVTELGFPDRLGDNPYRARMNDNSLGSLFVRTKRVMGSTPWCWYDGPNPPDNHDSGLFNWDGRAYRPNRNYFDVVNALSRR